MDKAVTPFQLRLSYVWDKPQVFMGTVSGNEFRVERIIQYRNSFVPTIYGRFLPAETGLQVRIVMLLSPIVLMLGIVLGLGALPVLASIVYRFMMIGHFDQSLKVPTLLVVLLYLMFTGGFSYEAVKARRLLNRLFEAELRIGG
ncbi:hypothetical protein GCM10027341_24080 [Spirosoma knui]